jgi:endonuclease/exonuclease/phosphatase family metal-dependent hydrolase
LPGYARVHDNFCGWNEESNIYYNLELFEEIEHGRIDLFMPEINRGLFYLSVRCKVNNDTLFISTVHLTHQGNAYEVSTGKSYRHDEAVRLSDAIIKLTKENEGALICGDFNDPFLPLKIIHDKTGFNEVFNTLHLAAPVTFSCTQISDNYGLTESIDKIIANKILCPIMATSPRIASDAGLSDHYPVEAMFEVTK